jgi:hypothetical protein
MTSEYMRRALDLAVAHDHAPDARVRARGAQPGVAQLDRASHEF